MLQKMKSEVINEINIAVKTLSLHGKVKLLDEKENKRLYNELLAEFVKGADRRWWWESLSKPSDYVSFKDGKAFQRITYIVPDQNEIVWFMVEDDMQPFYPIFETTPQFIAQIIGECFAFEYYIIDKTKEWLLCENHHDSLIGVGKEIIEKIEKIKA
jgi:hypothetical protein